MTLLLFVFYGIKIISTSNFGERILDMALACVMVNVLSDNVYENFARIEIRSFLIENTQINL